MNRILNNVPLAFNVSLVFNVPLALDVIYDEMKNVQ